MGWMQRIKKDKFSDKKTNTKDTEHKKIEYSRGCLLTALAGKCWKPLRIAEPAVFNTRLIQGPLTSVSLTVHLLWLRNTGKPFRLAAKKHIYNFFVYYPRWVLIRNTLLLFDSFTCQTNVLAWITFYAFIHPFCNSKCSSLK